MNIIDIALSDIEEAPFNYNLHPQNQLDELCKSLEEFGQFKNVVLWQGYCIAGNGLVFAARSLGWESLKAVVKDDLTDGQAKRLCVADNATPYLATPDPQKLEDLLKSLPTSEDIPGVNDDWLDMVGLSIEIEDTSDIFDETYTKKITAPIYKPTGLKPGLEELLDSSKTNRLIEKIKQVKAPKEEKTFLIEAAKRHLVFNYQRIAEYYAQSDKKIQELMEESALVIIDFEQAIENGYVRLSEQVSKDFLQDVHNG